MSHPPRPQRIAATAELTTLIVLLTNLATAHLPSISSLAGPAHGCAYLFTVIAVARDPRRTPRALVLALLPGVGGLLALRQLARTAEESEAQPV